MFLGVLFVYCLWLIKNIYNYFIFDFLLWKTDREIDHVAALFLSVQVDEDKVKFMQRISACISLCQFRSLFTDNLWNLCFWHLAWGAVWAFWYNSFCIPQRKKVIQVSNNIRMSKWLCTFRFLWNYSFKSSYWSVFHTEVTVRCPNERMNT